MEQIEVNGVVLREIQINGSDKILTLLTAEKGKITVSAKGAFSYKNKHSNSAQMFAYSNFILKKTKKYFYIADSEMLNCFYDIRFDPERLALASYICDVANELSIEDVPDIDLLRLTLNTLYMLADKQNISCDLIKPTFEFRALCDAGFMPSLDVCGECGGELKNSDLYIDVMNGHALCYKCGKLMNERDINPDGSAVICPIITDTVLSTLRYIESSPLERIFSYNIPDEELEYLNEFTETYLESHFEHSFSSLNYYRQIKLDLAEVSDNL